ncbi:hypothetical protein BMAGB8_1839 [Burkholderia mallei GB8 horse 4]|nr:hypothetical protein BMAGB8_1839 [Burkholderia mallei GB8 horse 4]
MAGPGLDQILQNHLAWVPCQKPPSRAEQKRDGVPPSPDC